MKTEYRAGKGKIELAEGSITRYNADAIVIPANPDLDFAGMGVQGFVARDGGIEIFDEASRVADEYARKHGDVDIHGMRGKVPLYSAHLTTGGRLPAKHVIHSVALDYDSESGLYCNKDVIAESTRNVLELGKQHGLTSIGFPALGTGLYQVPLEEAVEAMTSEFEKHLAGKTSLERLGIVLFGRDSYLEGSSYLRAKKAIELTRE
jgi:O-acetyl-ADP-ribose deacetylase (regulator of RNase III)